MAQQQKQQPPELLDEDDPSHLAGEIESRLREYLGRAAQEYPPGCQADWLAGVVADRMLRPTPECTDEAATQNSLVKLCVFLMENLADVANSYEEFYSQQMAALRDESASAHAQVAALEDENVRLREHLHRGAEELRTAHAAIETLKARNLAVAASTAAALTSDSRFDEAVPVDDDEESGDDAAEAEEERPGGPDGGRDDERDCRRCARFRETAERAEAEATRRLAEAAAASAALKADVADWEADMAEKVHQNVELAAQLETCQRMLARLQQNGGAPPVPAAATAAATRGIFGGLLVRKA